MDFQPELLITLLDFSEDGSVGLRLEPNLVFGCGDSYDFRLSSARTEYVVWIQIDGLYVKNTGFLTECRPVGNRRLQDNFNIGEIAEGETVELIFTFEDRTLGSRINKYILTRRNGLLNIEPKDGGFTTVIGYEKEGRYKVLEKYSEKYLDTPYYNEVETFNNNTYFTY